MKNLKKILALCLAGMMVFSMAACGGTSDNTAGEAGSGSAGKEEAAETAGEMAASDTGSQETETKDSGEREKIVISCYLADDAQVAVREKYIDGPLSEAFPDVDIEIKMYSDRQSLQVEVAGGGGPDILDLDGPTDVAEFAKADRVMDLGAYAEKYGWQDMFYDWAYNSSYYNGKLYSLPTAFEGMVMYYNLDVMEEHGWEIPKTKEELVTLMQEVQAAGLIPITFGNAEYQGAVDWLYSTFSSCYAGPQAIKDVMEGKGKYTDDAIKASFQTMVDWWQAGYIGEKATQSVSTMDILAFFSEGRAPMMINGTWAANQLLATYPDCNWDSEMMPQDESIGEILPFATAGAYAINKNSSNPDLAAEVLNYLFTSLDRHYDSIREAGYQPYPLKVFDLKELEGIDAKLLDQYTLLMDAQAKNQIGYCSWTFYPSEMRVYMNENTDALFLDMLSVDDFLTEAQKYVDEAIENGTMPILP